MDILQNEFFDLFSVASDDIYMYICDMKRDYSRWSRNTIEVFGVSEYVYRNGEVWMEHIHPDDRAAYQQDIEAVFSGKKERHECEYRARTKEGNYIWLKCSGTVKRDENGEPIIFAGMMMRLDAHTRYDPVTHLRMATFENEFVTGLLSTGTQSVALLLGVDGFRQIVNNYGFDFGDSILFQIGQKLAALCAKESKQPCAVARFVKDEFVIFLTGHTQAEAEAFFQQVKKVIREMELEDSSVDISVSAGGLIIPAAGESYNTLVTKGEHALEYAKEHKRGGIVFYSEEIEREHNRRIQIRNALAYSINHNFKGFELYFQPIVAKGSHRMSGCETLLRWKYGMEHGIRMDETIDELEKSGYISQVGDWVLETCLKLVKGWQEEKGEFAVNINVSAIQFRDVTFVQRLIEMVQRYQVNPRNLVIELTESANVENVERLADSFQKLRDAGIRVSLDDFGTEHSTLTLLRDLPVDEVKIDQSFILQLDHQKKRDAAIVESTIELCNKLGVMVVVEGLETQETIHIVENYDIDRMQGFYFARPMPVHEFEGHIFRQYEVGA